MSKINPKLIDEVFDDSVLAVLPSNKNLNIGVANAVKAQNPQVKKALSDAIQLSLTNPETVKRRNEGARRGGETKRKNKEYQQLMTEVNRKKAENPSYRENVSAGIKKKHQDPAYKEKMRKKAEFQSYKVKDPNGKIWNNANEAGQAWFPNPNRPDGPSRKVRNLISKSNSGWSKI